MTNEEAIKGLKVLAKDFSGYKPNEEMFDIAIKAIEQTTWIPVSERLPSDCNEDWVLAQIQEDNGYLWIPCVAEYLKSKDDWYTNVHDVGWIKNHNGVFKVVAWMPLPEPYKGE